MPTKRPQLKTTVSEETAQSVRDAAAHLGQTVSEWIAATINRRLEEEGRENVLILPNGAMMKINNPRSPRLGYIPVFEEGDSLENRTPVIMYEGEEIALEIAHNEGESFYFLYLRDLETHQVGAGESLRGLQVSEAELRVGLELIRLNKARKDLL